jgi:long-chain acyl-CoA synthetase
MQKNDFDLFRVLNKYNEKIAIFTDKNEHVTYKKLIGYSIKISKKLNKNKSLVFLLGQNNLETLSGYLAFANSKHTIVFLDYRINNILLKNLINLYKPNYIFLESHIGNFDKNYYSILNFKSFILLHRKKDFKHKINDNLMLMMSTSGTTGSPKFVKQSYLNIKNNSEQIIKYLKIKKKDITITSLPISYVYGLSVINTHLLSGATIVLTNSSMVEKKFWDLIDKYKVTNFSGVPYNYLLIERIIKKNLPKSLIYTTQAGGKMNTLLLKSIIKIYKKNKVKLFQMYGAAEATARMSYLEWKDAEKKLGSIGKVIPGGKFYLLNSKGLKISKANQNGELIYEGNNVFMGYANNLKSLSFKDENKGKLKTGDIAYRDKQGFYYIVGRKNRYIKIYGIRVNLAELESFLSNKGYDTIMKNKDENKIQVYFQKLDGANKALRYLSKLTSINRNVFVIKKILKKNITSNFKYKI